MRSKTVLGQFALLIGLFQLPVSALASDPEGHHHHEFEEHQAHLHGAGLLTLVQDQHLVQVSLEVDTHSLWGFEHAPADESQWAKVEQVMTRLEQGHALFSLNDPAQCRPDGVNLSRPEGLDNPSEHGHMELEVSWQWRCEAPSALNQLEVGLFAQFPELHSLTVQRLTAQDSGGGQLDRQHTTLSW
ncbi:ZrgA family zinc uptake protein [Ferrimonas sp.]|uniref:ZrgA family zinc uptake protein n=1 Tax=Ferrimonas sp. TaxID=2080861 RepID=UPI003A954EF7